MRFSRGSSLVLALLVSVGCSGTSGDAPGGGASGSPAILGGGAGTSSAAGSQAASGSSSGGSAAGSGGAFANAGSAGSTASVGGATGGGGTGGASGGASAGTTQGGSGGAGSVGPFSCTLVLGLFTTSQWFNGTDPGGADKTFLQDGVDATKWEGKMKKYSYVEKWADPKSDLWDIPMANPCAANSTTPDRAVFVSFSPSTKDQPSWEKLLNSVMTNIQTKYPSVKEIDLLTMGRAPNNMLCPNNSDVDTIIAPYEDAALQAVADASHGLIKVGPKYYVPDCDNSYIFANDTDYTTTASNYIATEMATYYIAHP